MQQQEDVKFVEGNGAWVKKTPMVPLSALMGIECYHHFLSNGLPVAGETQLTGQKVIL
jgi:hypothetical protein